QRDRSAQLADQPGGVERRPARQLGALEQHDVGLPAPREVVRDARAADSAADDHDAGAVRDTVTRAHASPERISSYCGPSSSALAESYFSIPQDQKSKSIGETPSWIDAHSVQP